MVNQKIQKSFILTKQKIEEFKKLNDDEKEKNLFFLKTALSDIIFFVNYTLIKIGKLMNIDVSPNHSIKQKRETIDFFSNILSPEEKEFFRTRIKN